MHFLHDLGPTPLVIHCARVLYEERGLGKEGELQHTPIALHVDLYSDSATTTFKTRGLHLVGMDTNQHAYILKNI